MADTDDKDVPSWLSKLRALTTIGRDIVVLVLMAAGGLMWGIKLDNRQDTQRDVEAAHNAQLLEKISKLESLVNSGVLPVTAERLREQQAAIVDLRDEVRNLHDKDVFIMDRLASCERWVKR